MNMAPDGPPAIPLWINGHAFLTVVESFFSVVDPHSGEALYRVPLCGAAEATEAAAAARAARPVWTALTAAERQGYLTALAEALASYAEHFAKLLRQETGWNEAEAAAEVEAAVAALKGATTAGKDNGVASGIAAAATEADVLAIVADAGRPLAALCETLAPALLAGATVVVKPSPRAPSAPFALCELSARAGWPAGVLNLLQGDEAAIEGLCATETIDRLVYVGAADLGDKVAAIAARRGKAFSVQGR